MSSRIIFNATAFRAVCPAFLNPISYPDAKLQIFWDTATAYVSDINGGCYTSGMSLGQQTLALNYMTAHLMALSDMIAAGVTPGIETGATIDKISVTLQPPPQKDQWQWWLNTTPYGQQLLALLQVAAVGGFFYGAFPIVPAFRR